MTYLELAAGTFEYLELAGGACNDCTGAIAGDSSGIEIDRREATAAGIKRIGHDLVIGDEIGFSWAPCGVCRSWLGGNRHAVGYLAVQEVSA